MKKLTIAALIALTGVAFAQDSTLKAGLWEMKQIRQVMDGRDMSSQIAAVNAKMQQAMANMTPEQRKQMESMMKGAGAGSASAGSIGSAARICISPAMAAKNAPMVDREGSCPPAKVARNGNKSTFEFNCITDGRTMVGSGENIMDGDTITTSMDMTITDAKGHHTMHRETQMTYLGADCQGVKSADQIMKDIQGARQQK